MRLKSIAYSEFKDQPREWTLGATTFDSVNLIVGKNASGKSRLLNVTAALAKMLRGETTGVYQSGHYEIHLSNEKDSCRYEVGFSDRRVEREIFAKNDQVLLDRGINGIGKIWSEGIKQEIEFEAPPKNLAAQSRRDSIQHPFFEDLHVWASDLRHIQFGTPLGRDRLYMLTEQLPSTDKQAELTDSSEVAKLYAIAFDAFGAAFDESVLRDFAALGYDCTDVGLQAPEPGTIQGPPLALLFVQERDLRTSTNQLNMSQGMFRALSLVIQLNYWTLRAKPRTILIDDIGEGLDFRRAQQFISLLIERALKNNIQLVMTSNDRFIMNGVQLKYWGVLIREAHKVKISNVRNSEKVFKEFEELGLNNFDFFSSNFFEEGRK